MCKSITMECSRLEEGPKLLNKLSIKQLELEEILSLYLKIAWLQFLRMAE